MGKTAGPHDPIEGSVKKTHTVIFNFSGYGGSMTDFLEADGEVSIADTEFNLLRSQGARTEKAEKRKEEQPQQDKFRQV
jgi:hypothetical protein